MTMQRNVRLYRADGSSYLAARWKGEDQRGNPRVVEIDEQLAALSGNADAFIASEVQAAIGER